MSEVVIRVVCRADGAATGFDGEYLVSWDVDAHDGRGSWETSPDIEAAHVFASAGEAFSAWRQQSKAHPTRAWDGQPNRPLTALTIETGPPTGGW